MTQKPNEKRPPHLLLSTRSRTVLAKANTKMYHSLGPRTWNAKGGTKDVDEVWVQLMPA
jgi:hypothetical protein